MVVWPYGYSLKRERGEILVLNGKGKIVAKVRMGGGRSPRVKPGPRPRRRDEPSRRSGGSLAYPTDAGDHCGCLRG